jgi:hypothetical protein
VSWQANQDVSYQVMQSSNLISWTEIGDTVLLRSSNGLAAIDVSDYAQTNSTGFFRVVAD